MLNGGRRVSKYTCPAFVRTQVIGFFCDLLLYFLRSSFWGGSVCFMHYGRFGLRLLQAVQTAILLGPLKRLYKTFS